eukprot:5255430-Pleurochrysis_carterae.AAC.2
MSASVVTHGVALLSALSSQGGMPAVLPQAQDDLSWCKRGRQLTWAACPLAATDVVRLTCSRARTVPFQARWASAHARAREATARAVTESGAHGLSDAAGEAPRPAPWRPTGGLAQRDGREATQGHGSLSDAALSSGSTWSRRSSLSPSLACSPSQAAM